MPSTPNRGYTYPATTDPATVPAHLGTPLNQIDADVQSLRDGMNQVAADVQSLEEDVASRVYLNPDGTLPDAAEQQVAGMIDAAAGTDIQIGGTQPAEGWWLDTEGRFTPPTPDTTPPTAGTLGVVARSQSATLTVTGASDDRPGMLYAFSQDNGAAWSAWQTSNVSTLSGLTPGAGYTFRHKVKDQAGNETVGAGVPKTLPDYQSDFRSAVLALNPWQYWPLDDPIGTPLGSLRNLGSASGMDANGYPVSRALQVMGGNLGAPTLGDGNTAAEIVTGASTSIAFSQLSADLHLYEWSCFFLVKLTQPYGYGSLIAGPFDLNAHSSGRLIPVTIPATGTKVTPTEIQQANWPGVHMVTMTQTATRSAVYWDSTLIGYVDGPPTVTSTTGVTIARPAGIYSSLTVLQGKALTAAEVASLRSTLA